MIKPVQTIVSEEETVSKFRSKGKTGCDLSQTKTQREI